MKVLGVHGNTHESGCALVEDGHILGVISQERIDRQKMSDASPVEALEALLRATNISADQIDWLAFSDDLGIEGYATSRRHFKRLVLGETLGEATRYYAWKPWALLKYYRRHRFGQSLRSSRNRQRRMQAVQDCLVRQGFRGSKASYEHGYCHATTAYYCSGFDSCLIFVMEGASFINASSVYLARGGRIKKILDILWPHSPGVFYSTITRLLGFRPLRHEGKITGLAAYGDRSVCGDLGRRLFHLKDDCDDFHCSPLIHLWWWDYRIRRPNRLLPKPLRSYSREDLSAAWQVALEEAVIGLVQRYLARHPDIHHLALAGGVHGNVKLNQRINELDGVEEIYVHAGMGDCGQPLGAALACWAENDPSPRSFRPDTVYFGPSPAHQEIDELAATYGLVFEQVDNLPDRVAELLTQKKVVGICRGRMEYGPRALGNRSILYSATDRSVNDWLNRQLRRTEFMPFAPVTLIEQVDKCYVNGSKSAYTAGFMTICYDCTDFMKRTQPAVVHVDGTARPQYISRHQNPFYYDLLARYYERTGLPSIVNTSFNMHEEPIVCTAGDAIRSFVASNLDALVLEDRLLLRDKNPRVREMLRATAETEETMTVPDTLGDE
jgi:carbamoyltransferase